MDIIAGGQRPARPGFRVQGCNRRYAPLNPDFLKLGAFDTVDGAVGIGASRLYKITYDRRRRRGCRPRCTTTVRGGELERVFISRLGDSHGSRDATEPGLAPNRLIGIAEGTCRRISASDVKRLTWCDIRCHFVHRLGREEAETRYPIFPTFSNVAILIPISINFDRFRRFGGQCHIWMSKVIC